MADPAPIVVFIRPPQRGEPQYVADGLTVKASLQGSTIRLEFAAAEGVGRKLLVRRIGRTPRGGRRPRDMG